MNWHEGRLCLFDLESTGVDPHRDRIVTAAVIEAGAGQHTVTREWLVDPGIEISEGATAVHGISTEHARTHGRRADVCVKEIALDLLSCTQRSHIPVVGHNVSYDLTLLHAELIRHGHSDLAAQLLRIRPVIDTFVLDKWADRYRKGSRKLVDVAAHYGVDLTEQDAHGAAADALAAGRIAWHIANKYPGAQGSALVVHDWLIDEKREQAESFGAYLRKQGKPDDVSRDWPIQPLPDGWSPDQLPTPATESEAVA
ncbi:MAG: 3'-5' exonuclease [Nonomuraea sp.]|nr:3'-5' exonuclease [Nonomuraea sp.]NUQ32233.1 3'-5' exonuclease [Dermatophilaceae bacterium]NUR81072.1 3'-5' exonuclease [Dermatophilaceae bacterium]